MRVTDARNRDFVHNLIARYGHAAAADRIQEDEAAADLAERFGLIGTDTCVRDGRQALADAGVTVRTVTPIGDSPRRPARVRELMD